MKHILGLIALCNLSQKINFINLRLTFFMIRQTFKSLFISLCLISSPALAGADKLLAPKKPLEALEGVSRFTGDVSGNEITVVQYWASWCTGCAVVMAEMTDLLAKRQGIGYVTVSLDDSRDLAMKFFANKSDIVKATINRAYLDPSGATFSEPVGVDSLPYLMFVRKDGTIVKRIKGHPTKSDLELLTTKG
jgi:thiol-disulfide isomerase/thioredoxin